MKAQYHAIADLARPLLREGIDVRCVKTVDDIFEVSPLGKNITPAGELLLITIQDLSDLQREFYPLEHFDRQTHTWHPERLPLEISLHVRKAYSNNPPVAVYKRFPAKT